jgi:hypothetical protein
MIMVKVLLNAVIALMDRLHHFLCSSPSPQSSSMCLLSQHMCWWILTGYCHYISRCDTNHHQVRPAIICIRSDLQKCTVQWFALPIRSKAGLQDTWKRKPHEKWPLLTNASIHRRGIISVSSKVELEECALSASCISVIRQAYLDTVFWKFLMARLEVPTYIWY